MTPILYVTGEASHASTVASSLQENSPYGVITVRTATEARRELNERSDIRCLLCGEPLPDEGVFEFIESVRRVHPDLPVVFYPTEGSEALAVRAISADVTEYLTHSDDADHVEELADTIRSATDDSLRILSLRERIKELRGIKEVTNLLKDPASASREEILRDIVDRIPPSFQYPAITEARVTVGETSVATDNFEPTDWMLTVETVTEGGIGVTIEVCYLEARPAADDGPFLSEERSYCTTLLTLVKGGVERQNYVEDLKTSEETFQELAENLDVVLWVSDPSFEHIHYVNPEYEAVWGYSTDSLYEDPRTFLEAVHPEDRRRVEETLLEGEPTTYDIEYRIINPNGNIRWVAERGVPVLDEDGTPYRMVGISEDITERKRRDQQMAVLNRVLRHNLRNDLGVVSGYADLIGSEADGEIADYAETILSASTRLVDLSNRQRDLTAQLESLSASEPVDLSAVLQRVTHNVIDSFPDAEIDVEYGTETTIEVSPLLKLALEELLINAVKHTDVHPPRAEVTVEQADDDVVIQVIDTGDRIPEMELEVLGNQEEPLFHGTGIGMWIVYWIVNHIGGSLAFDEANSGGNVVTVRLLRTGRPETT